MEQSVADGEAGIVTRAGLPLGDLADADILAAAIKSVAVRKIPGAPMVYGAAADGDAVTIRAWCERHGDITVRADYPSAHRSMGVLYAANALSRFMKNPCEDERVTRAPYVPTVIVTQRP